MKVQDMRIIYLFIKLSIYKSSDWIIFFTKWSLKLYTITKFKFIFFKSIYTLDKKNKIVYIIWKTLSLNFNLVIWKKS
jgi:hypothetical protein